MSGSNLKIFYKIITSSIAGVEKLYHVLRFGLLKLVYEHKTLTAIYYM